MNAEIKVVIWDLDETFWNGTLSEGEVQLIDANVERAKLLNRRGVVNAICSKNDHVAAQAKLEELGLWDRFVFASIHWGPRALRSGRSSTTCNCAHPMFCLWMTTR